MSQLIHDETFRRLCRGRDLLASGYQSRILLEQAAREACLSEFQWEMRRIFGYSAPWRVLMIPACYLHAC